MNNSNFLEKIDNYTLIGTLALMVIVEIMVLIWLLQTTLLK